MKQKVKNKSAMNVLIAAILVIVIKLAVPPVNGLTELGVNALAAFAGLVYLWIFESVGWVSVCGIILMGCTGVLPYSSIYANSFGSWVTVFYIVTMILNFALTDMGITSRIVTWAISRKMVEKRPWMFLFTYLFAIYAVCLVLDCTPASLVFLPMTIELCEQIGCEKGEKLPKVLMLGVMCSILLAYAATPISHGVPVIMLGLINNDFEGAVTFSTWSKIGIPTTLAIFAAIAVYFRLFMKPDVSKILNYDAEAARNSMGKMTRAQKITSITYLLVILAWLGPEIFSGILPGFADWLSAMGYCVPVVIAIIALMLIQDEGKPILDWEKAVNSITWPAIFLCACIMVVGPILTNEATGITACVTNLFGPIVSSVGSWWLMALLATVAVVVLTQFMFCLVTAQIIYTVLVPLIIGLNDPSLSGLGFGITIGIVCNMGIMTPPASGPSALFTSCGGWYTVKDALKYSLPIMIVTILAGVCICYPLAAFV